MNASSSSSTASIIRSTSAAFITVEQGIQALVARSANDVATAFGERTTHLPEIQAARLAVQTHFELVGSSLPRPQPGSAEPALPTQRRLLGDHYLNGAALADQQRVQA